MSAVDPELEATIEGWRAQRAHYLRRARLRPWRLLDALDCHLWLRALERAR